MKKTCCPLYPIRCKATEFQLNRSHKKIIKKVNAFLNKKEEKIKKSESQPKNLEEFLENDLQSESLVLKLVKTDSAEFQATIRESQALYVRYQTKIHQDEEDQCTMDQFKRFLVKSPLKKKQSGDAPSMGYGSFHQQYWLDEKLIAVGVIDILPRCVSSVYFFYDPDYGHLSLGTYASLREIAFVRQLAETCPSISWYYLGFYIHSCPKMSYKAQYKPSYLSCPESFRWSPIADSLPKLDQSKFSRLESSGTVCDEDGNVNLSKVGILHKGQALTYEVYQTVNADSDDEETVKEYASLVGMKTAKRMLLYRSARNE